MGVGLTKACGSQKVGSAFSAATELVPQDASTSLTETFSGEKGMLELQPTGF